jgi:hypothetical protein
LNARPRDNALDDLGEPLLEKSLSRACIGHVRLLVA